MLVTTARIKAVYLMLLHLPPFNRWGLEHPDKVQFAVTHDLEKHGGYNISDAGKHRIEINPHTVVALLQLVETVAHEMVHMRQEMTGKRPAVRDKGNGQHNKEFYRLANLVCRDLGFDPTRF